jgi:hypothetical protein
MKKIQIDKDVYNLPEGWHDVIVNQFLELRNCENADFIKILSILISAPYDKVFACDPEMIAKKVIPMLGWYFDETFNFDELKIPPKLSIRDSEYPIPRDIRLKSFGQKIHLEEIMRDMRDPVAKMPYVVAIYMYPVVTKNKFDIESLDEFTKNTIGNCKITEIYPIANFFLTKLKKYFLKKKKRSLRSIPQMN